MLADRKRQSRKRLVMGLLLSLVLHCETATAVAVVGGHKVIRVGT